MRASVGKLAAFSNGNFAADVPHLGELGGFDLDERRLGQFGQPPCDFSFADPGGTDHENIFGRYFVAHIIRQLLPSPPIAQGNGNCSFGFILTDDKIIQFADDFLRSQRSHKILPGLFTGSGYFYCLFHEL